MIVIISRTIIMISLHREVGDDDDDNDNDNDDDEDDNDDYGDDDDDNDNNDDDDDYDIFAQGGREHNLPILVSRVTSNSPAAR